MDLPQNTLAVSAEFLIILRRWFQYVAGANLPQWAWNPTPSASKILIELAYNIQLETIQQTPAIAIQRGSFGTRRSTFGDKAKHEWPGYSKENLYSTEVYGTMNFNVYSLEGGEAEAIANIVFEIFVTQQQLLEREFKFKWLGEPSVGPLGVIEEDRSVFIVPVTLSPVVYDMAWRNTTNEPLLKRLRLTSENINQALKETVYTEYFP